MGSLSSPAQAEEHRGHGRDEGHGHGYGRRQWPIAGLHDLVGDDVAEHVRILAADEEGHRVGPEHRDEGEEDGGHDAAADIGQEHAEIGLHARGAQVARGLEEGEVELVDRGKEGKDRVGDIHVDEDENHRALIIEELYRLVDQADHPQEVVQESLGAQDRDPSVAAHEEVGPEGYDHEEEHEGTGCGSSLCYSRRAGR